MPYYLGLSVLNNEKNTKELLSAEARRILSRFENRKIDIDDFSKEAGGRPFFPGKDVDFNISHSGNIAAVLYTDKKGIRVGCDIEKIKPRVNIAKIAKGKFNASENKFLNSNGIFNEKDFIKLWTLKESYIKLRGLSIFDMSKIPSFITEENETYKFKFCADVSKPIIFRLYELSNAKADSNTENFDYIMAEAIEGEDIQPELTWLSSSSLTLDCKLIAEIKASPS